MSLGAALIILAIIAVMVVFIAVEYWSTRPKKAADPECTLDTAWDHYLAHPEKWSDRDQRAIARLRQDHSDATRELRASLRATVDEALAASEPLVVLRRTIMDATDRFVMAETLFPPAQAAGDSAARDAAERSSDNDVEDVLEAGVLRCFSLLRFGDFAEEDWYSHYLKVAETNAQNVAAMVRKTVEGEGSSLETSLHEPLTHSMREAREVLLHWAPQVPVERTAELALGQLPARRAPSQKQIDALTDVMSERFEKLFTGQVYQLGGTLVSRAAAFQVDAALLYTQLSTHFRQPAEAWRRIMNKSLGRYEDAMQSEEKLLQIVQDVSRRCREDRREDRLSAALTAACETAFRNASGAESDDPQSHASSMREEARLLISAIHQVAAREE